MKQQASAVLFLCSVLALTGCGSSGNPMMGFNFDPLLPGYRLPEGTVKIPPGSGREHGDADLVCASDGPECVITFADGEGSSAPGATKYVTEDAGTATIEQGRLEIVRPATVARNNFARITTDTEALRAIFIDGTSGVSFTSVVGTNGQPSGVQFQSLEGDLDLLHFDDPELVMDPDYLVESNEFHAIGETREIEGEVFSYSFLGKNLTGSRRLKERIGLYTDQEGPTDTDFLSFGYWRDRTIDETTHTTTHVGYLSFADGTLPYTNVLSGLQGTATYTGVAQVHYIKNFDQTTSVPDPYAYTGSVRADIALEATFDDPFTVTGTIDNVRSTYATENWVLTLDADIGGTADGHLLFSGTTTGNGSAGTWRGAFYGPSTDTAGTQVLPNGTTGVFNGYVNDTTDSGFVSETTLSGSFGAHLEPVR